MGEVVEGGIPAEQDVQALVQAEVEAFIKTMTGATQPSAQPHVSRWAERDARRKANAQLAREAAERRVARKLNTSIKDKVAQAATRLDGTNAAAAISIIAGLSQADRDYYILAEKYAGQNRKSVLQAVGASRGSVERQYLDEVGAEGVGSPE